MTSKKPVNRFGGYLTIQEFKYQFKAEITQNIEKPTVKMPVRSRDVRLCKIHKGLLSYLQKKWNEELYDKLRQHIDYDKTIVAKYDKFSKKNMWLESTRNDISGKQERSTTHSIGQEGLHAFKMM